MPRWGRKRRIMDSCQARKRDVLAFIGALASQKLSDYLKSIYRKTTRDIRILFASFERHCNL
uniref:Uncharacterized protein n=1 Tax=Romanomermis culicivorax TaxID=13658 RepID=A0A915IVT1_ROMCU